MKRKPLTMALIAGNNLRSKPFRTACLIIVVTVLSFALFGGSVLSESMKNGMDSLQKRLGADLAVVPLNSETKYEGILLSGDPGHFYLDKSIESKVAQVDGVSKVCSQFYLSTLSAECCSIPVQIIGFDSGTDFVTGPWIAKTYDKTIADGELIVGYDINVPESGTLKFFNQTYPVVAKLDKTSTGMDNSVFTNMNTIRMLTEGAQKVGMNLNSGVQGADINNSVSAILVKLSKGYDADTVVTNIRRLLSGVSIVKSKSIFSGFSNNLNVLLGFITTIEAVISAISVLVLAVMFSVIINERKKEFALLRLMGATRKKLVGIVLTESSFISVLGGFLGTAIAALFVFPFSTYIGSKLNLPYLIPDLTVLLKLLAVSLVLSFAVGPLSAVYSAIKISRTETYTVLREGE